MSMAKKKSPSPKTVYRIRNWSAYNQSLVKRGSITVWVDEAALAGWQATPPEQRKRGGQYDYSDAAITVLLVLKSVYHLSLRETEGFACSLFELMKVELPVPDYTTLSRRAGGLAVSLPAQSSEPIHLVLDSTGLKIYGEGEWKVRQHGYSKRRTWRKLHLGIDEARGEIQAVVLSEASLDDAAAAPDLLAQTQARIEQVSGDGAYDKGKVYTACQEQEIATITIPPRRDARIWQHGNCKAPPHPRDENLRRIRRVGRKTWKRESGYHRRSLAETMVFRFKMIFGHQLQAREIHRQVTEARIKCLALNRMTRLGMPDSYPVAI
jgi:IS5 family transposase